MTLRVYGGRNNIKDNIYVFSNGELKRKDNTFCFVDKESEKNYLPIENINDLYVMGEVTITKKFLELMSKNNVVVHFFNYYGYYAGSFCPKEHYNSGEMILCQCRHYEDKNKRFNITRRFIEGSIMNMIKALNYYSNRTEANLKNKAKIEKLKNKLDSARKISQLMAAEGNARKYYYKSFDEIVTNEVFKFQKRSKQPPKNQMNALISFGNSMLYATILGEIYKTQIDPRIGFLHSTNSRSFTLNLDIAEVFKPIIVDRIIFSSINKNVIVEEDFVNKAGGTLLSEKGRKKFLKKFDEKLNSTIYHRKTDKKISYRRLLRLELYKLQNHLNGKEKYSPYVSRW